MTATSIRGGGESSRARELLTDLLASRLEVILIPSRDPDCAMRGGMIRAAQERNADWYREFCREFPSNRKWQNKKGRTKIKRRETIRGLKELISGRCETQYADRLRIFIVRQIANERHEERRKRAA